VCHRHPLDGNDKDSVLEAKALGIKCASKTIRYYCGVLQRGHGDKGTDSEVTKAKSAIPLPYIILVRHDTAHTHCILFLETRRKRRKKRRKRAKRGGKSPRR
jgi:hypothetical protein